MALSVGCSTVEDWPDGREGLLLAPGPERVCGCGFALLLKLVNAVGQVAEAGQYGGAVAIGRTASVLTERDIASVMGAVFDGRPVAPG
jgi:hypothetical protein